MMKIISASAPAWSDAAHSAIDLLVTLEGVGEVPFTAAPNDPEPHGRTLFARAVAGDFGAVAPYVPPALEPVSGPWMISRAQGKIALIQAGLWQSVLDFVTAIPSPVERAIAQVALHDTQYWEYDSPFLRAAAEALGLNDIQRADMFRFAATIRV